MTTPVRRIRFQPAAALAKSVANRKADPLRRHSATCEANYTADEDEFIKALLRYKQERHVDFPTATDYLAVLKSLGYRKC